MTTPEASSFHNSPKEGVNLWVERGFSRREITARMRAAVPSLNIFSTPSQPLPDTHMMAYPSLRTPEGIASLNEMIEEHNIDAIWPQDSAHHDLSAVSSAVHAAATPDVIKLVDDKVAFSEWLEEDVSVRTLPKLLALKQSPHWSRAVAHWGTKLPSNQSLESMEKATGA